MASAWGDSWGAAWGDSWGLLVDGVGAGATDLMHWGTRYTLPPAKPQTKAKAETPKPSPSPELPEPPVAVHVRLRRVAVVAPAETVLDRIAVAVIAPAVYRPAVAVGISHESPRRTSPILSPYVRLPSHAAGAAVALGRTQAGVSKAEWLDFWRRRERANEDETLLMLG